MRRIAAWIGGIAGAAAGYALLRRRVEAPAAAPDEDTRAEELRAKLAETRAAEEAPPADEPVPEETLEERRRRVHEEGRAAIDEMQGE